MRGVNEVIKEGKSTRQFVQGRKIIKTDSKVRVFQIDKNDSSTLSMKTKWTHKN